VDIHCGELQCSSLETVLTVERTFQEFKCSLLLPCDFNFMCHVICYNVESCNCNIYISEVGFTVYVSLMSAIDL
jgi:hypothetical protein